jgi:hypothetical protein
MRRADVRVPAASWPGIGGAALAAAVAAAAFAAAVRPSASAVMVLVALALIPYAGLLVGDLRRALLAAIVVDVLLQWDVNLGYQSYPAELGAEAGLSLSLTTLALVGLYGLWFADRSRAGSGAPAPALRPARALIAYVAISALSVAVARDRALAVYYVALLLQTLALFVYVVSWVRSRSDVLFVLTILMAALVAESLLMVGLYITGANVNLPGITTRHPLAGSVDYPVNRVGGTISSPNMAGGVLALLLGGALGLLAAPVPRRLRGWALAALATGVPALIVTGSRGAWIAFVIACAVMGVFAVRRGIVSLKAAAGAAAAVVLLALPLAGVVAERVTHEAPRASSSRLSMARLAVSMIEDRPLLGVGVNNVGVNISRYAGPRFTRQWLFTIHDKYLLVASESGLAALAAFLWFLGVTVVRGWRAARSPDLVVAGVGAGLSAGLVGQMVHMTVDIFAAREAVQSLWLVAAMLAALARMAPSGGIVAR